MFELVSNSTEQTVETGEILGKLLKGGNLITLFGDLGTGKTHFAKGVALGLGVEEHITSPTFTIINEYFGRLPFFHMDAYRLTNPSEAEDLGLEEYLFGEGVTLIEWPQILKEFLPKDRLEVKITKISEDDNSRKILFEAYGACYQELIRELKKNVCSRN